MNKLVMTNPTVLDLLGAQLDVTDINAAIANAAKKLADDLLSEYWSDLLMKLQIIKEELKTVITLVSTDNGFNEYYIKDHPIARRACVSPSIKKGDIFNVYFGDSIKNGIAWQGDLLTSLNDTSYDVNGYKLRYNPFWKKIQVSHDEIGFVDEFTELSEAIDHCQRG